MSVTFTKRKADFKPLTKSSLIQLAMVVPVLWIVVETFYSITAIAWVQAALALTGGGIKLVVAGHILKTSLRRIVETLETAFLAGVVMLVVVLATLQILNDYSHILQLAAGVLFGFATYVLGLWWLQQDVLVKAGITLRAALMRR